MAKLTSVLLSLLAIPAALSLGGCYVSDKPLFAAAETVQTLGTGRWKVERLVSGQWRAMDQRLENDRQQGHYVYRIGSTSKPVAFDLIPLDATSWIVQLYGTERGVQYLVLSLRGQQYYVSAPDCTSVSQADVAEEDLRRPQAPPAGQAGCQFASKGQLKAALAKSGAKDAPFMRLTYMFSWVVSVRPRKNDPGTGPGQTFDRGEKTGVLEGPRPTVVVDPNESWVVSYDRQIGVCGRQLAASANIEMRVRYKPNGLLDGEPVLLHPRDAVDHPQDAKAAMNAVKVCVPVTLPPERYREWKEIDAVFTAQPVRAAPK